MYRAYDEFLFFILSPFFVLFCQLFFILTQHLCNGKNFWLKQFKKCFASNFVILVIICKFQLNWHLLLISECKTFKWHCLSALSVSSYGKGKRTSINLCSGINHLRGLAEEPNNCGWVNTREQGKGKLLTRLYPQRGWKEGAFIESI